mmetsp:Transcript_158/g.567  ORF Transcript_158/g.567 Transcript_158/m.567 type:complete len:80 (-) Transcript_158:984-1223(-)
MSIDSVKQDIHLAAIVQCSGFAFENWEFMNAMCRTIIRLVQILGRIPVGAHVRLKIHSPLVLAVLESSRVALPAPRLPL